MRPQQKSFVVEIKSKGRRSAVRQGSIWGTTDLKAIAQQAASFAPQIFDDAQKVELVETPVSVPESTIDATSVIGEPASPFAAIDMAPLPAAIDRSEQDKAVVVENGDSTTVVQWEARHSIGRERKPRLLRKTGDNAGAVQSSPSASSNWATIDDLSALETENQHLKTLLTDKLRQQNVLLLAMLSRFIAA